jgi:hypothetical protein
MYKSEREPVIQVEDEQLLTRYLLGDLAPAHRQAIEDRLTEDPVFFEAMCALEDEVILKWHRGELAAEDWQFFTQSYLQSPSRQARVAAVRELIDAAERWKHEAEPQPSLWSRMPRWLTVSRPVPQLAMAAVGAVVIAVVPALLYQTRDAMKRLQDAEREITSLRQTGGPQHVTAVFTLAPVTVRGQEKDATNVVRVPRDAADVWLRFEMADPGTPAGFDAILEPLDRGPAATPRPARLEPTATGMLVTLTLPASDLKDGDYVLRLRRLTAGDSSDIVATRTLRVTRD